MASGLATRCSACGTVFRIVPDQLRVSEGWVRCGRCAEVFNAAEGLFDLESTAHQPGGDKPAPRAMAQFSSSVPVAQGAAPAPPVPVAAERRGRPAAGAAAAAGSVSRRQPAPGPMPVVDETASRFSADAADAGVGMPAAPAAPAARAAQGTQAGAAKPQAGADAVVAPGAGMHGPAGGTPLFMRQAERAARWRRPPVRAALRAGLVLGVLGLAAQTVHEYRDLVAARFTAARPLLQQACVWLDCNIGAAHVIDGLVVESSGLVRVEKSDIYRLNVALRNRAELEVAVPALELSLTDSQGKLVSRRVLRAAELGVTQATLAAGRDLALQATLQAATAPVAGYTIELFYP